MLRDEAMEILAEFIRRHKEPLLVVVQTFKGPALTLRLPEENPATLTAPIPEQQPLPPTAAKPTGCTKDVLTILQVAGDKRRRDYLIYHHPANKHYPARTHVLSLPKLAVPGDLDLRRRNHAKRLEAALAALNMDDLEASLSDPEN